MKEFAIFPVLATVNAPQSGFDNSPKIRRVAELSGPQIERIKAAAAVVFLRFLSASVSVSNTVFTLM